jgi:hypothetical protein
MIEVMIGIGGISGRGQLSGESPHQTNTMMILPRKNYDTDHGQAHTHRIAPHVPTLQDLDPDREA